MAERQGEDPSFDEVYKHLCAHNNTSEMAYWLAILWKQVQDQKEELRILRAALEREGEG